MKHSKLWTALALPLMLAACAKSDKAGVTAPDCLNISGEWVSEGESELLYLTQDGCSSLSHKKSKEGEVYIVTTSETKDGNRVTRAEFEPSQIRIIDKKITVFVDPSFRRSEKVDREQTVTLKLISDDILEITINTSIDGESTNDPSTERYIRVKPVQMEQADATPVSETQTIEVKTEAPAEVKVETPAVEQTPKSDVSAELPKLEIPKADLPKELPVTPSTLGLEGVQNQSGPGISLPGGLF